MEWPSLDLYEVVTGRPASAEDVNARRAAFVLNANGRAIGTPVAIPMPQYVTHIDAETGARTPYVAIQAEDAGGKRFIGCFAITDGTVFVGFDSDFIFHGNTPPSENQNA